LKSQISDPRRLKSQFSVSNVLKTQTLLRSNSKRQNHHDSQQPSHRRKPMAGFVGEHKARETPDPIPNSEVKPGLPMILLRGKVGHRRLYGLRWVNPAKAFFVFAQSPLRWRHLTANPQRAFPMSFLKNLRIG
jgi:hypothetical protein